MGSYKNENIKTFHNGADRLRLDKNRNKGTKYILKGGFICRILGFSLNEIEIYFFLAKSARP